ncbi:MAG: Eco57I restriction-modification methylase domain-containing protein [Candidatus Delongbacteria bacterium]|nr:Eco57I restriction-modification methylase domain-containing protein [Candidatus Delongbacteria bacterium]MCG2760357.1 BREX-1 system adenine-specific DNA-methyltransferase PglX [Candidatus Delongbacteria bacterium]
MSRELLKNITENFSISALKSFFRDKMRDFKPVTEDLYCEKENFTDGIKLGETNFGDDNLVVCAFKSVKELTDRSSKKSQYEVAKKILKNTNTDAGIFIFYDTNGNFRFSLIYTNYLGTKRDWSLYKRFTYYVNKSKSNKTFLQQIGSKDFSSLDKVKSAFSLAQVTKDFYDEFFPIFQEISSAVTSEPADGISQKEKEDFALLFVIRTIFIGFIQKRKWIGDDENFLEYFLNEYNSAKCKNELYKKWIKPLFFESLNSPPGRKTAYGNNDFSPELEFKLQMAPYLNGGLFSEDKEIDRKGYFIPDAQIKKFFDFLFSYNFTIEENTLYDEELELNPEFLGIIFEKLVNKADGAIYTPRTEVDMMCRLSLVKWILKNNTTKIDKRDLYEMFFQEAEKGEEFQRHGSFSTVQYKEIISLLERVTVCDPAVGSGAFLVGMMQVIDEIESHIYDRLKQEIPCTFDRKKRIISQSLYGVEVKEWAVWIAQLRLWISLFIDAPDSMRDSLEPILPSLDFKTRQGDSLVQMIGSKLFPVSGHAEISSAIKRKVTLLKNIKADFFFNKKGCLNKEQIKQQELKIFKDILEDEIDTHRNEIRKLQDSKVNQDSLFLDVEINDEKKKDNLFRKQIDEHKAEIEELQAQKISLSENKPLIWSIEFSEIFVENGGFDIIIGNPPYVRQESIADPMNKIEDKKKYKDLLAEMVRMDFPDHFIKQRKINAQSDLYTYFYIRSLKLLNPNGIHTFICSNSWLDVGYGSWLQEFLLESAPVDFIIDNHAKRSFDAADVNTIISVINAPVKHQKINHEHQIKFIAFKKPFEQSIFTEYLLEIENAKQVKSTDTFRVYPITIKDLKLSGTEYDTEEDEKMGTGKYTGEKWGGKFLRAPDIFFTILEKGKGKLVKLRDIADVRFGIKTGANEFFYITEDVAKNLKIEKEFLKPINN